MPNPNIVIYAGDSVRTNPAPLMNSGFTTVLINSLHAHDDGSLWLNNDLFVNASGDATSAATSLGQVVGSLKQNGGVSTVLVSFGGGGSFPANPNGINAQHSVSDSDYKAFMAVYWAANGITGDTDDSIPILNNFNTLLTTLGADGLDLDGEPMFYTYEAFASANAILHEWALGRGSGIVTWAPFQEQQSWAAQSALITAGGYPPPTWINLQPPAWPNGASDITSWAQAIGIQVSAVVPGFDEATPADIQSALAGVVQASVAITGAYFYNYDDIVNDGDVAAYATAILNGLAGKSG
jgi:hypothetical protein